MTVSNSQVKAYNIETYVNEFSNSVEDCFQLRDGLWVTNSERTICEMIKYDRDIDQLMKHAKKYVVKEKLQYFLNNQ